jgi:hypothetical protein
MKKIKKFTAETQRTQRREWFFVSQFLVWQHALIVLLNLIFKTFPLRSLRLCGEK